MTSEACVTTGQGTARRSKLARSLAAAIVGTAVAIAAAPASAAVVYDETISGDLSNSGLSPTPIAFALGSNTVTGTTGHDSTGAIDRDYFTFTIGADQALTAINVLQGTQTIGLSFFGIQSGSQVTLATNSATAAGLLGWTHYDASDVGTNILDDIGIAGNGSAGFSGPLRAGTYSVWLQEISPGGAVPFAFDFVVVSVPEPSTWAMLLAGFGILGLVFRTRRMRLRTYA